MIIISEYYIKHSTTLFTFFKLKIKGLTQILVQRS